MFTDILDYYLPPHLIAQTPPSESRAASRLLVCHKKNPGHFEDRIFSDIASFLNENHILVLNNAKVMPARLNGYKYPTGARIEIFLLEKLHDPDTHKYKALLRRRRRLEKSDIVLFPESSMFARVIESDSELGEDIIELDGADNIPSEIEKIGKIPLPPYIDNYDGDMNRYQTVYAKNSGSVAAPTAGLHFSPQLLSSISALGVDIVEIHLRVGWGTFNPIRTEHLEDHKIHPEWGEITSDAAEKINAAKSKGKSLVAVGTTVTRLLESSADFNGLVSPFNAPSNLYIYPGYEFKVVDKLITNFHLPRSSLIALVMAFMGIENTKIAYQHAIQNEYRFYSFGDAMFIV